MSQISSADIKNLANLAMLELSDNEILTFQNSIENILDYVSLVAEANLPEAGTQHAFTDIARDDVAAEDVSAKDLIFKNVRQLSPDGFVEVNKVINK